MAKTAPLLLQALQEKRDLFTPIGFILQRFFATCSVRDSNGGPTLSNEKSYGVDTFFIAWCFSAIC